MATQPIGEGDPVSVDPAPIRKDLPIVKIYGMNANLQFITAEQIYDPLLAGNDDEMTEEAIDWAGEDPEDDHEVKIAALATIPYSPLVLFLKNVSFAYRGNAFLEFWCQVTSPTLVDAYGNPQVIGSNVATVSQTRNFKTKELTLATFPVASIPLKRSANQSALFTLYHPEIKVEVETYIAPEGGVPVEEPPPGTLMFNYFRIVLTPSQMDTNVGQGSGARPWLFSTTVPGSPLWSIPQKIPPNTSPSKTIVGEINWHWFYTQYNVHSRMFVQIAMREL